MNNVAEKLYNILGTKFNNTDIKTLDATGKETTDMEEIKMFSFDFLVNNKNYGPVVILLSATENLEVYYGDNTSKSLDSDAKKKWENLIEHLSTFARSNRLGFSLKHTSDLKYDLSNIADITESYRNIFEGYYGTRKTSYSPQGKAKIIIKHSKTIGEDDKRFRNISSLFIENADGERFKLPFTKLAGARAMARHVTEGGNPYDLFGVHISEMVKDINTLGGFVRRSRMYEGNDEAMSMVETGRTHYNALRKSLKQIAGVRGYNTFKENWEPSEITTIDEDTDAIRKLFMDNKVNARTEDALPLLARLQKMAEARGEMDQAEKIDFDQDDLPYDWAADPDNPENRDAAAERDARHEEYYNETIDWPEEVKGKQFPGDTHPAQYDDDDDDDDETNIPNDLDEANKMRTAKKIYPGYWADWAEAIGYIDGNKFQMAIEYQPTHITFEYENEKDAAESAKLLQRHKLVDNVTVNGNEVTVTRKKIKDEKGLDEANYEDQIRHRNKLAAAHNPDSGKPSEEEVYNRIKFWSVTPLRGYARRIGMSPDMIDSRADAETLIDEIMGYQFDDDWEMKLIKAGAFAETANTNNTTRNEMKEITEFENWADQIVEGTWSFPDNAKAIEELKKFMSTEQPVGIDAINASDALYHILGDDDLFDSLSELAENDPDADARITVKNFIEDMYRNVDGYAEDDQPAIINLYNAVIGDKMYPHEVDEALHSDLDADTDNQLNASINKDLDAHMKNEGAENQLDNDSSAKDQNETKGLSESINSNLQSIINRTHFLLQK